MSEQYDSVEGIAELWQTVLDHRALLERDGDRLRLGRPGQEGQDEQEPRAHLSFSAACRRARS